MYLYIYVGSFNVDSFIKPCWALLVISGSHARTASRLGWTRSCSACAARAVGQTGLVTSKEFNVGYHNMNTCIYVYIDYVRYLRRIYLCVCST